MSWRRFAVLLGGLSPESVYRRVLTNEASKPRVLTGADASAFFSRFKKVSA